MIEITGKLFEQVADAFCITTNGFITARGNAVMGKGCAKEAAEYYPRLPALLGSMMKKLGNVPMVVLAKGEECLCTFPVKPVTGICNEKKTNVVKHMRSEFKPGDIVPGWACVADIELIKESAQKLVILATMNQWKKVIVPRPGCGCGELKWEEVKQVLAPILDDRFHVITFA